MSSRVAVVLFNLGGPDSLPAVRPFLRNLFRDPAIIGARGPLRWALSELISRLRERKAQAIYRQIGGASPLEQNTRDQAQALERSLNAAEMTDDSADSLQFRCFVAMRYWHPFIREAAAEISKYSPDKVILVPLYPQFSTTTTKSSFTEWKKRAYAAKIRAPVAALGCYPTASGFVDTLARDAAEAVAACGGPGRCRVLFSAHGLPQKTIDRGDPYQWQVEQSAAAIAAGTAALAGPGELDWAVCYQSRVGPMTWIGPAIGDEIERAGAAGKSVVLVPLAFVSEHSETLVELDIQYKELAAQAGVPQYRRIATVGAADGFIATLADQVRAALSRGPAPVSHTGGRLCPPEFSQCICAVGDTDQALSDAQSDPHAVGLTR